MAVNREFFCPRCRRSLQMSDAMSLLAEAHQSGGSYIVMASTDSVACPGCGCGIGVEDIVAGKYSPPAATAGQAILGGILAVAVWGGIILLVVRSCS